MILGQVTFFFAACFSGQVQVGQVFFFFIAWYEWARYDVGQLTEKNVYIMELAHQDFERTDPV